MKILFYSIKLEKFLENLEKSTLAKVVRTLELLEKFGSHLTMPHSRKIAGKLFELRVRGGQEIRIFYTFKNGTIVLLHAFIKKTQKTPSRELEAALNRLNSIAML